jgi:RNA-binding protein
MLTPKNKALLKKLANPIQPSLTIGKGEVDATLIKSVDAALEAHELIKLHVLTTQGETLDATAGVLAEKTKSDVVEIIGRMIVLYRPRKKNPTIVL